MPADQTEVVCQYMAIQFFAELGADSATTDTASQSAKDGARDCTDGDAKRSGKSTDSCTYLATGECGTCSSCSTAEGTNSGADRRGCSEGNEFFRVTARALK